MQKLIAFILATIMVVAIWYAIMRGAWALWRWVLPQLWEGGPQNVLAPGFWLFVGCWTLVSIVGRAVFGGGVK